MTASKRKDSVGVASPMSLHIFHLSQRVYSQRAKLLYLGLVAADLNSFAAIQNTKWVILCGERQEYVKQLLAVQVAIDIFSSYQINLPNYRCISLFPQWFHLDCSEKVVNLGAEDMGTE